PENKVSWKDRFIEACKDDFDDFSFNCYHQEDFSKHVADLRASLESGGATGKSIYIAEYNLTAAPDNPGLFSFPGAVSMGRAMRALMQSGIERASFSDW